jgi:hypothetical protein
LTSSRRQLAHFMPIAKLKQVFSAKRQWKEDLAHHKCVVDQGHAVSGSQFPSVSGPEAGLEAAPGRWQDCRRWHDCRCRHQHMRFNNPRARPAATNHGPLSRTTARHRCKPSSTPATHARARAIQAAEATARLSARMPEHTQHGDGPTPTRPSFILRNEPQAAVSP